MKMHYSISELYKMSLEILPSTERGIQIRVQKESWPFIEVAGKGGKNGKRREYAPPPDVMKQIQARKLEEALGGLADLPSPTEMEGKPAVRNEETALALPETVCIVDGSTEQQRLCESSRRGVLAAVERETEENNRAERIASYLVMLSHAAQHFVDAAVMVNNAYGRPIHAPKGVWFEFEDEVRIDKTRAERDKMYLDAGQLVLTEEYYRDVLGFEESHFKLRELPALPQQTDAKMSLRLSDGLARHAPDTAEQAIARPKMEAVLGLLESCKDYAEFEAKLSKLDLSQGDNLLIQRLVSDGLAAWADGADDGRD